MVARLVGVLHLFPFLLAPLLTLTLLIFAPPPPLPTGWVLELLPGPAPAAASDREAEQLLEEGQLLQRQGRYAAAVERYRAVLERPASEAVQRSALFLLGEALYLDDRDGEAIPVLAAFVARAPDDPRRLAAIGIMAKASQIVGAHDEAVRLFREYRAAPTAIGGYLALEIGESLGALGRLNEAVPELEAAASAGLARLSTIAALEQLASVYARLGDDQAVAHTWQRLQSLAQADVYQAEVRYRRAAALARLGRGSEATALFLEVVQRYPHTGWAAAAVRELARLGSDPGPYLRGISWYTADREADAVTALTEFLTREPGSALAADALLHRGLAYRYLGQPDRALADFERAASTYPGQKSADEALFQAGQLLEHLGRGREAISAYQRLADRFPSSSRREEARYRAALLALELGDQSTAQATLAELARAGAPTWQAAANLWLGKLAAASGNRAQAEVFWQAAEAIAPGELAGLRARSIRQGEVIPQAPPPAGVAVALEDAADLRTLDRWVGALAGITVTAELRRPGPALLNQPAFQRGEELLRAGFYREATEEFRELAATLRSDPLTLYQLVLWLDEQPLPRASAFAAEQLVAAAPGRSLAEVPRKLLRLVLPTPYRSLVEDAAHRYGVDPLLLFALIRQESAYDRYARSSAGARGLTQVMPATGEGIARALGRTSFTTADLYRPEVAIEFGAYYLAEQLTRFNGNVYQALAAYNAGPAAVPRWTTGLAATDPDLFLERIAYRETSSYVRLVGTFYYLYRLAYRE